MSIKRDLLKEKLLDPKQYSTVYISKVEEERAAREQIDTLVELLTDDKHKSSKAEVFNFMKKEKKAVDLLVRAIGEAKENKSKLIATCWEADLDCDRYVALFTGLTLSEDLGVAMEALTTVQNMRQVSNTEATQLLEKIKQNMPKQVDSARESIIADLVETLRKWQ
jgi:hypothetical protein